MPENTTRLDSSSLANAFGGLLANRMTGLGTARDKGQYTEANPDVYPLDEQELSGLYRKSGVIQRAVSLYPLDAMQAWCKLNFSKSGVLPDDIFKYAKRLGLREAIAEASLYSRWFGEGYVLMGVADGGKPEEEINREGIKSIRWLKVYSRWEVRPVRPTSRRWSDVSMYEIIADDLPEEARYWHKDRVLRISGVKLDRTGLWQNSGSHDPIIQSMYESFCAYYPGLQSVSVMVQDHRLRKFGVTNLADANKNELYDRVLTNDITRSTARSEIYDKDLESIDNLTNNYGGLDKVVEILENAWSSDTDIARVILFNQMGKAHLTSGDAFKFSRLDHAYRLNSWQENTQRSPLETAFELIMLAADSPTKGQIVDGYELAFPLNYRMTPEEELTVQKLAAERDEKYTAMGAYDASVIRRQFQGAEFDYNITFEPEDEKRLIQVDESKREAVINLTPPPTAALPPTQRKDSIIPDEIVENCRIALAAVDSGNVRCDAKYIDIARAVIAGNVDFDEWRSLLGGLQ